MIDGECKSSVLFVVTGLVTEALLLLFFVNGQSTFELVIDNRGAHSDENFIPGAILSFDAVYAGSPVITMLQKSKQTSIRKN